MRNYNNLRPWARKAVEWRLGWVLVVALGPLQVLVATCIGAAQGFLGAVRAFPSDARSILAAQEEARSRHD